MSGVDYYKEGSWNAVCFECGRKRKADELKKHWKGYYVCPEHWEPRHPQDFVSSVPETLNPPWTQPPVDLFTGVCTPNGLSAVPLMAEPGCLVPGFLHPAASIDADY